MDKVQTKWNRNWNYGKCTFNPFVDFLVPGFRKTHSVLL
jgi:hypothetical protein